jgi:hypothetical protein
LSCPSQLQRKREREREREKKQRENKVFFLEKNELPPKKLKIKIKKCPGTTECNIFLLDLVTNPDLYTSPRTGFAYRFT